MDLGAARTVLTDEDLAGRMAAKAPTNGGGPAGRRFVEAAQRWTRGIARIAGWGVVLKDLDAGLCDFPALRDGREVELCWRLGEERVEWWHEIGAGFAGRRPIDDRFDPGAGPA